MRIRVKHIVAILGWILAALCVGYVVKAGKAIELAQAHIQRWVWPVDDLPGKQIVITGQHPSSGFGWTVTTGDVNGDDSQDLIVDARFSPGQTRADGKVYAWLGPIGFGQTITAPQQAALILQGTGGWQPQLGTYLDSGDLNGDGYDDIIVGSGTQGTTYVYLGSSNITATSPLTVMVTPSTMALTVWGAYDGVIACNVNGDAYDDLFVENQRGLWGILGNSGLSMTHPLTMEVGIDPVDVWITGFQVDFWVSPISGNLGCGDVDGDGYDDLVVGSFGESPGGRFSAGRVYVIRGSTQISSSHPTTVDVSYQADLVIEGIDGDRPENGDLLGTSLAVGDVNSDGRADLILGAPYADGPNNSIHSAGEVYLWLGRDLDGQTVNIGSEAKWVLYGDGEASHLGLATGTGDVDGDGRAEVILGCESCGRLSVYPYTSGRGYAIDADQISGTHCVTTKASLEISSSEERPFLGRAVEAIDIDIDGYQDIVITAISWPASKVDSEIVLIVSYPIRYRTFLPLIRRQCH
jgi:hypothetical protein